MKLLMREKNEVGKLNSLKATVAAAFSCHNSSIKHKLLIFLDDYYTTPFGRGTSGSSKKESFLGRTHI